MEQRQINSQVSERLTQLKKEAQALLDERKEIDVSGVAKVGELDGVDDSFFELNEIDLRNIEVEISNVQNGIMEFEDCENVQIPLNVDATLTALDNLTYNDFKERN